MSTWVHCHSLPPVLWKVIDIFTYPEELAIYTKISDDDQPPPLTTLSNMAHAIPNISYYRLFCCCYIPIKNQKINIWVFQLLDIITTSRTGQPSEISYVTLWFNKQVLPPASILAIHSLVVHHSVSHTWH